MAKYKYIVWDTNESALLHRCNDYDEAVKVAEKYFVSTKRPFEVYDSAKASLALLHKANGEPKDSAVAKVPGRKVESPISSYGANSLMDWE